MVKDPCNVAGRTVRQEIGKKPAEERGEAVPIKYRKPATTCLNCGKPTLGGMFCGSVCRAACQSKLNRFHASLKPMPASAYAGELFEERKP